MRFNKKQKEELDESHAKLLNSEAARDALIDVEKKTIQLEKSLEESKQDKLVLINKQQRELDELKSKISESNKAKNEAADQLMTKERALNEISQNLKR